jgi:hypothetical protein
MTPYFKNLALLIALSLSFIAIDVAEDQFGKRAKHEFFETPQAKEFARRLADKPRSWSASANPALRKEAAKLDFELERNFWIGLATKASMLLVFSWLLVLLNDPRPKHALEADGVSPKT